MHILIYTYMYIYIHMHHHTPAHTFIHESFDVNQNQHSPASLRRFPSFRTQPLESLSVDSVRNRCLSNPTPGENLLSGNLVMETGCSSPSVFPECSV